MQCVYTLAATVAVKAMREADPPAKPHTRRSICIPEEQPRPRQTGLMLSQSAFNWKAPDRYVELLNFQKGVANVFQAKVYDLSDEEKVPITRNWLGREGLQFIQTH